MAITIIENLKDYNPAFNDMEIQVSSNNIATTYNFKYIFEVFIDAVNVGTIKTLPEPVTGNNYGYVDVNEIVGSYIETQIADRNSVEAFQEGILSPWAEVVVKFGEEFSTGSPTAPIIEFLNLATTGSKYAWNACFDYTIWISRIQFSVSGAFSPWVVSNGSIRHFLTNYYTPKVSINDLGWAWFLVDDPSDVDTLEIKTYDSSGVLIQTVNADSNYNSPTSSKIQNVSIAPKSLNNIDGADLSLGAQPIITASVAYYTIIVLDGGGASLTDTITCTIEEPCRYTPYRLHFLNKLGGFDAYTFTSRNQVKTSVERKQYEKHVNRMSASGIERAQEHDGKQDYYVMSTDSVKIRSEYLTEEEHNWLKELISSPQIYLEYADGDENNFRPVRMLTSTWEQKETSIDKLYKLELDIEFSHSNRRQRR
jgi:hypothetical protein